MADGDSHLVTSAELERLLAEVKPAAGNTAHGLFGPESASWKINRESALFLAAGRAALLQLAHPWVAAAIAEHSTTLHDPVARFHNTFRVMFTIVFGSVDEALAAARHLHRRHAGIRGAMPESVGPFPRDSRYEANELAALQWVYATLVDSALLAYELVLPALTHQKREQYYVESKRTAALFGIPPQELPGDWREFNEYLDFMLQSEVLAVSDNTRRMALQLQAGAGSRLRAPEWYSALTTHLLPPRLREKFQLPYDARQQRACARALSWLPRLYRVLPAPVRFVGPYSEARARLAGKKRPTLAVRLSNRLWVGRPTLFDYSG